MAVTFQGATFAISTTVEESNLDQAGFEALTFTDVGKIVNAPSFQFTANIITQNTLDSDIADKQTGFRQGEDTEVVLSLISGGNAGHQAIDAAARTKNAYAVRMILPDPITGPGTGTTFYARFIFGGGGVSGGGGEDFVNRTYQMAMTGQFPIEVDAT